MYCGNCPRHGLKSVTNMVKLRYSRHWEYTPVDLLQVNRPECEHTLTPFDGSILPQKYSKYFGLPAAILLLSEHGSMGVWECTAPLYRLV